MTDEYRRGPAPERQSLPANAQRHVAEARSSIPRYTPRRYSLGVMPPVADSAASMALARELSAAFAAAHNLPTPFVPVTDSEGQITGYTFVPREKTETETEVADA